MTKKIIGVLLVILATWLGLAVPSAAVRIEVKTMDTKASELLAGH